MSTIMTYPSDIRGAYTALVTPFAAGAVDEEAFAALVEWQIAQGINGLVPVGTTGESPTLSTQEHLRVVEVCVDVAAGRVPVMAGTGSNNTEEAIFYTQHAQKAGASSALLVVPYYNKPTQEGLFLHFKAVHDATEIPLVVYNIPGRSVVNLTDDTLCRLAELPRIVGIKDATGDLARVAVLRHRLGERFALLSGEDMTTVGFNAMGGQGVISVLSNIAPQRVAEVQTLCLAGDYVAARQKQDALVEAIQVLFSESSPIPVKAALTLMNKMRGEIRLPLTPATEATIDRLRSVMHNLGIL
jgi:4-hydroxy-tetrahydrodipicolinate synthase